MICDLFRLRVAESSWAVTSRPSNRRAECFQQARFGRQVDSTIQLVQRIWELMDRNDEKSWDWESVIKGEIRFCRKLTEKWIQSLWFGKLSLWVASCPVLVVPVTVEVLAENEIERLLKPSGGVLSILLHHVVVIHEETLYVGDEAYEFP